jgi:hypothetical protein
MTVTVMRCAHCRKGLDVSNGPGKNCEYCGGGKWDTRAAPLTFMETIRLYRVTDTLFYFEPKWWLGPLKGSLIFLEAVGRGFRWATRLVY